MGADQSECGIIATRGSQPDGDKAVQLDGGRSSEWVLTE